jgi:vacuolar protein sorting-associated protein 13A/C
LEVGDCTVDVCELMHSGSIQFYGLHLKKSLLERFGLPVEIIAGTFASPVAPDTDDLGDIGNLSISIPWTQLKTEAVRIEINDVYILARARPQGKVDPEEDARVEQATKQEKLKSAEAVDNAASQVTQGNESDGSRWICGDLVMANGM